MPTSELPRPGLGTFRNEAFEPCAESVRIALEAGYRHVDTAQMYGNEAAVGEGLRRADVDRDAVVVATKLDPANLGYDDALRTAHESAERLGVDVIDLLYVHWPIRTYDPDGTLRALDELVDEGLVRHVGLSNFEPDQLADAIDRLDAPVLAHQVELHPLLPQAALQSAAREHDHWLVAYAPVARGAVEDVPALRDVAEAHDATPYQVALAWLLARDRVVPIPKATSEAHLRENLAARDLTLTSEELARIDAIEERRRLVDFEAAPWNRPGR